MQVHRWAQKDLPHSGYLGSRWGVPRPGERCGLSSVKSSPKHTGMSLILSSFFLFNNDSCYWWWLIISVDGGMSHWAFSVGGPRSGIQHHVRRRGVQPELHRPVQNRRESKRCSVTSFSFFVIYGEETKSNQLPLRLQFCLWTDGLSVLLGREMSSESMRSELEILLSMEIKLRLLDLENVPIPDNAPVVPKPPSNFNFCYDFSQTEQWARDCVNMCETRRWCGRSCACTRLSS